MAYKYIVVSVDAVVKEGLPERVGFLGTLESPNKLHTHQTAVINGESYHIVDAERKDSNMIYVTKMVPLTMTTGESESDIVNQRLSTIIQFISKHNIKTFYYIGGVRLEYTKAIGCNKYTDLKGNGRDLTHAVLHLRSQMIDHNVIQRGEW